MEKHKDKIKQKRRETTDHNGREASFRTDGYGIGVIPFSFNSAYLHFFKRDVQHVTQSLQTLSSASDAYPSRIESNSANL